jgi:hypothetical protein
LRRSGEKLTAFLQTVLARITVTDSQASKRNVTKVTDGEQSEEVRLRICGSI